MSEISMSKCQAPVVDAADGVKSIIHRVSGSHFLLANRLIRILFAKLISTNTRLGHFNVLIQL